MQPASSRYGFTIYATPRWHCGSTPALRWHRSSSAPCNESAAFSIDRYGHLYDGADAVLLDGLAAGYVAPTAGATVLPLRSAGLPAD